MTEQLSYVKQWQEIQRDKSFVWGIFKKDEKLTRDEYNLLIKLVKSSIESICEQTHKECYIQAYQDGIDEEIAFRNILYNKLEFLRFEDMRRR